MGLVDHLQMIVRIGWPQDGPRPEPTRRRAASGILAFQKLCSSSAGAVLRRVPRHRPGDVSPGRCLG